MLPHYWGGELASDNYAVRLHYKHSNDWGVGGCCESNATNTYQKILIDLHKAKEVPQLTNGDNVAYLTIGIALGVELVTRIYTHSQSTGGDLVLARYM